MKATIRKRSPHSTEYPLLRLSREHVLTLARELNARHPDADALPATGIAIADADPSTLAFFTGPLGLEPQKFLDWIVCGTLGGLKESAG